MRIYFQKEQKNKCRKIEATLLAIASSIIAASFILKTKGQHTFVFPGGKSMLDICLFHKISGYPCPSCGLTRSFINTAHLSLTKAFRFHFLGPLLFTGVLLTVLYLLYRVVGGKRKITINWTKKEMYLFLTIAIAIVIGAWISKLYFRFF